MEYKYCLYNGEAVAFEEGIFQEDSLREAYSRVFSRVRQLRIFDKSIVTRAELKRGKKTFDLSSSL